MKAATDADRPNAWQCLPSEHTHTHNDKIQKEIEVVKPNERDYYY